MAFIEGYSQLESFHYPLSIERISHISKSPPPRTNSSTENHRESPSRSPFVQRMLTNRKNHRTYTVIQEKSISPPASPSLYELTRHFFTRTPPKTFDIEERETVSNVPNRTTLVTWRSLVDTQSLLPPPPPPIFYRTIIDVKQPGRMISRSDDDDDEPDIIGRVTNIKILFIFFDS